MLPPIRRDFGRLALEQFSKTALFVLLFVLAAYPLEAIAEEPLVISLEDAGHLALAKSPRLDQALAALGEAREQVEVTASEDRFLFGIVGDLTRIRPPDGSPVVANFAGSQAEFQTQASEPYTRAAAAFRVRKLLLDGGRLAASIEASRSDVVGRQQLAVASWHQLFFELQLAFLQALSHRDRILVAEESLKIAQQNLDVAEKRWKAGYVPKADVISSKVPVANAELELTRVRGDLISAHEQVNLLMGIPQQTKLVLVEPKSIEDSRFNLEEAIAYAFEHQPQLLAYAARTDAEEQRAIAAKKSNNPKLQFAGDFLPVGFSGSDLSLGYQVGVELEWKFGDGGRSAHLRKQALYRKKQMEAQVALEKQRIENEIRQSYRLAELAKSSHEASKVKIEASRETLRVAQARYQVGLAPISELRDAHRLVVESSYEMTQSKYQHLRAKARLKLALGLPPLEHHGLSVGKDMEKRVEIDESH